MIVKIIYAILLIGTGGSLIKYRKTVKSWTGNFVWAEKYIGNGGTYVVLIMFGLLLIFLGVIYPFGSFEFGGANSEPIISENGLK